MERRFDAIVLVPLALVIGLALGLQFSLGHVPVDLISQTVTLLLGMYVALVVIELIVRLVVDGVMSALQPQPDEADTGEGERGELVVYVVRGGEVISQVNSWHTIPDRKRRESLTQKLGRLLVRQAREATKPQDK